MKNKGVTDIDEITAIAAKELVELALVDGGCECDGEVDFFKLKKFFKGMRRCENGCMNRALDAKNELGVIPSHDVAKMMKR